MTDDELILRAALSPPEQALEAWIALLKGCAFDSLDGKFYRALPAVYFNLRSLDPQVPWLEQLKGTARHAWVQNISRSRALMSLLRRLQESGIDYRLLKGSALAVLTNSWSTRVMGDVDILFHKKDAKAILAILIGLGARQKFDLSKNLPPTLFETWTLAIHTFSTDLDIHLARDADTNIFGKMLACDPVIIQEQGVSIKTPNVEWALIHAALHGKLAMSRSDPLQSILDTAKLLPLADLTLVQKKAMEVGALDLIEWNLRSIPTPSPAVTDFIRNLQRVNVRGKKKLHIRKLLSRNLINMHNIKKFLGRRPAPDVLKAARTKTKGRKWLYAMWLRLGQLNSLESMCIEKCGGFLDMPAVAISNGDVVTITPKVHAQADDRVTMGSIMGHDFRLKIRLPEQVRHLTVFLEYQFSLATFLGIYINGVPMGVLPLPGAQSGSFPVLTKDGFLELSLRSPCNSNEDAIDLFRIRCDWV